MEKENNHIIPSVVRQALVWLDRMSIPYSKLETGDLWEFEYDGNNVFLFNEVENDVLALYTAAFVPGDDEETRKLVFDFSIGFMTDDLRDCEVEYLSDGLAQVSQWWKINSPKNHPQLYKPHFIRLLRNLNDRQIKLSIGFQMGFESLFHVPMDLIGNTPIINVCSQHGKSLYH